MTDPTRPTVLLAAPAGGALLKYIEQRFEVVGPLPPPFESSIDTVAPDVLRRVRAILTIGAVKIGPAAMAKTSAVGLIACYGSGYEGVDIAAARQRGIALTYSPGANASSVADLAIALLLECARDIPRARARLYSGDWHGNAKVRVQPTRGVTGRRLGVYGLGAVGAKIAARACALEMEIGYHNRRPRPDVAYRYFDSLDDLARWADVLMIAVRADATNHHAVDRQVLTSLGVDGYVVNISRGSVIDEDVLIEFLGRGAIAGAGLDVFEHEPTVPPALLKLSNVALTPHIGGNTVEARETMETMVIANLEAFFGGRPVLTPLP